MTLYSWPNSLSPHLQRVPAEVEGAENQDEDGAVLAAEGVAGEAHGDGEERAAEEAHNHEAAHLVLLLREGQEGLGEDDGEDVGVAQADEGDAGVYHPRLLHEEEAAEGQEHKCDTEHEERTRGDFLQGKGACEAAGGAQDEVEAGGETGFLERHGETVHQDFRGGDVGTHVDAHVADDAEEAEQGEGVAQQGHALAIGGGPAFLLLLRDGSRTHPQRGEDGDEHVDGEEHAPAQSEGGDGRRGAPHGDVRGEERGDGLDELAEGDGTGQLVTIHDVGEQRIESGLQERVADAEEREREQHDGVTAAEDGHQQRGEGDNEAEHHGALAADAAHEHTRGYGEDQEPDEDE